MGVSYRGVLAQRENCGARETDAARQCPHATIEKLSRNEM
jgi:hypothetical protein